LAAVFRNDAGIGASTYHVMCLWEGCIFSGDLLFPEISENIGNSLDV